MRFFFFLGTGTEITYTYMYMFWDLFLLNQLVFIFYQQRNQVEVFCLPTRKCYFRNV